MALTDPLGDMLTRIRNGQQAKKDSVMSPASKLRARVLGLRHDRGQRVGLGARAKAVHAVRVRGHVHAAQAPWRTTSFVSERPRQSPLQDMMGQPLG